MSLFLVLLAVMEYGVQEAHDSVFPFLTVLCCHSASQQGYKTLLFWITGMSVTHLPHAASWRKNTLQTPSNVHFLWYGQHFQTLISVTDYVICAMTSDTSINTSGPCILNACSLSLPPMLVTISKYLNIQMHEKAFEPHRTAASDVPALKLFL